VVRYGKYLGRWRTAIAGGGCSLDCWWCCGFCVPAGRVCLSWSELRMDRWCIPCSAFRVGTIDWGEFVGAEEE